MSENKIKVLVLYNQVESDQYAPLRTVDPASLDFTPTYSIHVATEQEEYDAIVSALREAGFEASCANVRDDSGLLHRLITRNPPDVVFNLVEFFHKDMHREGAVAGFYELFRIRYTGSSPFCLSLCRRKALTKKVLLQNGLATPKFLVTNSPAVDRNHGLKYPLIIKPCWQDGSAGVDMGSVVHDFPHLISQLESVCSTFGEQILVEEFIEGMELHVSILGNNPPVALPVLEYDFSQLDDHPPVITYDIKWNPLVLPYHSVHSHCPARIDNDTAKLVKDHALRACAATYCRDYARVDLRLGTDGVPYILEVNPNPDLTEGVSFMDSAENAGLSFSETLRRIVSFALERQP